MNVNTKKKKTHRAKDVPGVFTVAHAGLSSPPQTQSFFWRLGGSPRPAEGAAGQLGTAPAAPPCGPRRPGHVGDTAAWSRDRSLPPGRRQGGRSPSATPVPRGCFRAQTPSQRGDVSFPAAARLCGRHPHSSRTRRDDERSCVSQAHIINDFDQFRAQFERARRPVRGQSARRPRAAGSKDDSGPRLSSVKGTLAYFLRGFVFNKHG